MRVAIKTKYIDQECIVQFDKYKNGKSAITLKDPETHCPLIIASVNLPTVAFQLKENETFIKNWSENEGVLKALQDAKVVGPVLFSTNTGYMTAYAVKILVEVV